jgi:hypothetical protein
MIFGKKKLLNVKCVFWFSLQLFSETFLIFKKIWARYDIGLHVKYPLFLSYFKESWIFSTNFRKNAQVRNFMKISQWDPSRSMRTYGQTDMTKAPKHVLMRMQTGFFGLTIWRAVGCYKWDNNPLIISVYISILYCFMLAIPLFTCNYVKKSQLWRWQVSNPKVKCVKE